GLLLLVNIWTRNNVPAGRVRQFRCLEKRIRPSLQDLMTILTLLRRKQSRTNWRPRIIRKLKKQFRRKSFAVVPLPREQEFWVVTSFPPLPTSILTALPLTKRPATSPQLPNPLFLTFN